MNTRKFVNVALVAACSFVLTACVSSSPPANTAPVSESPRPESTSSAKVSDSSIGDDQYQPATSKSPAKNVPLPKKPASANARTEIGAKEFAKFYFDVINYSVQTNDSKPLKTITTRACQVCGESLIDPADAAKKAGSWQVGGKHSYEIIDSFMTAKNKAAVTLSFETEKSTLYSSDGQKPFSEPGSDPQIITLGLEFDNGWKVYRILFDGD